MIQVFPEGAKRVPLCTQAPKGHSSLSVVLGGPTSRIVVYMDPLGYSFCQALMLRPLLQSHDGGLISRGVY